MTALDAVMKPDVLSIDVGQPLNEAITILTQGTATFGVVVPPDGLPALLSVACLRRAPDPAQLVGELAATLPRLLPVRAEVVLERVTLLLAKDLVANPHLDGLPVADAQGTVIGVVLRSTLVHTARALAERSGDTSSLEGEIISAVGMPFICRQDSEEKWVIYYQPANPPTCSKGHVMDPKR